MFPLNHYTDEEEAIKFFGLSAQRRVKGLYIDESIMVLMEV